MQISGKSKNNVLKASIITMIIFFGMMPFTASAAETTTVSIDPSSKTVSPEETFTVDVLCEPGQPMKSFEFKLSFDSSFLQVNSVTEGDIFSDYSTFFSSGTIDNTAGTVVDIYNLIVGSGNVSDSGKFVGLMVFFRDNVVLFFSQHCTHLSSNRKELLERDKIEKLDVKIQELKRMQGKIGYEKPPDMKRDKQPGEIVADLHTTRGYIGSEVESTSERKGSFNEVQGQEAINEDNISSIERKVDGIVLSKTKEKIDNER